MTDPLSDDEIIQLIIRAKNGDEKSLGQLLDLHRDHLRRIAESELSQKFSKRVDASDIIQQTYLSVCKRVDQFEGETLNEFIAWILRIHRHNIQDAAKHHVTVAKRSIDREQSGVVEKIAATHDQSSPSQRAIRNEETDQLSELIRQLPPDQSQAVYLRHIEGKTISEIAIEMDKTLQSVASLIKRGLEQLRQLKKPMS